MSRDSGYIQLNFRTPAAAAATTDFYHATHSVFLFEGWEWYYEAAEANTNNTVTVAIAYATDGTTFTNMKAVNSNAAGLLDSAAVLVPVRNGANPASGGAAWGAESSPADVRVPANAIIRVEFITAGTGTIPAIVVNIFGMYIQSLG